MYTTLLVQLTLLLPAFTSAFTIPRIFSRQSCVDHCGSVCYWQSDIDDAVNQGCSDLQNGNAPGGYPHQYNDYEGFSFPDPSPFYEFPILKSFKVYTGGSPGPDRVVFDSSCELQGLITHTGASGDDFVECS